MSVEILKAAIQRIALEDQAPLLIFGWQEEANLLAGGTYNIHEDLIPTIVNLAHLSLESIRNLEMSEYDGATQLSRGEQGIWVPKDRLATGSSLVKFLQRPDALDTLSSSDLTSHPLAFSAFVFGTRVEDRVFFVSSHARNVYMSTRIFMAVTGDLHQIKDPIISINQSIDFILVNEGAVVFDEGSFERFIQEAADAHAVFDQQIIKLHAQLPIKEASQEILRKIGHKRMTARGHMRSLCESDHFQRLTIGKFKTELTRLQLRPTDFISDNRLDFTEKQAPFILRMLNNGAWIGGFNGVRYTTDGKRRDL